MARRKKTEKEVLDQLIKKILREKGKNPRFKKIAINLRKFSNTQNKILLTDVIEELEMYVENIYTVIEMIQKRMPKSKN